MAKPPPDRAFPFMGCDADRYESEPGMSLRDYFAAKAIQGLAVHEKGGVTWKWDKDRHETIAGNAYSLADAMMKERDQ